MNMLLALKVDVPIACFRQSRAREYAETYPVPPPSTVYGMLLSMVGETDRFAHSGAHLALAMVSKPSKSTVIRMFRRFKKKDPHDPSNARPDYQELLTDVQFCLWIADGEENRRPTLRQRLQAALEAPETVERFGGLSLGESRDLINSASLLSDNEVPSLHWVVQDEDGLLALPVWVDHVGSKGTRWRRYTILESNDQSTVPAQAWTLISPA